MSDELTEKPLPKLSCTFCKKRKIKCDYKVPCTNCLKFNKVCEPTKDMRRKKFSKNYIMTLKNQVSSLESFIRLLKKSDPADRDVLLQSFEISNLQGEKDEEKVVDLPDNIINKPQVKTERTKIILENEDDRQFAVYGKPSIFIPLHKRTNYVTQLNGFEEFQSPVILRYISNFFIWKYMENNLYIYRESFLTDFFRDKEDMKESLNYCNEELILAVCAHGSLVDFEKDYFVYRGVIYDSPEKFYNKAKEIIFDKLEKDDCNNITSIQTLLTLAFFDLGRGRILSAWVLSGLAFRIGAHMGFEVDLDALKKNDTENKIPITDYDINVKGRIYWGCRVADYYISFLLGRAPTLEHLYATIPKSKNLPPLHGLEYFMYMDPVSKQTTLFNISDPLEQLNKLYEIVNKYHKLIYRDQLEQNSNGLAFQKWHNLDKFNLACFEWKDNLNHELYWTKNELKVTGYNPDKMFFRYQYYLVILLFNRDYVGVEYNGSEGRISPETICARAIEDVFTAMKCFSKHHKLEYASLNMIYLCILSIVVLDKLTEPKNLLYSNRKMINFFAGVLKNCSHLYGLAESAYRSFSQIFEKHKLQSHWRHLQALDETQITVEFSPDCEDKDDDADSDDCIIPSLNYTESELVTGEE